MTCSRVAVASRASWAECQPSLPTEEDGKGCVSGFDSQSCILWPQLCSLQRNNGTQSLMFKGSCVTSDLNALSQVLICREGVKILSPCITPFLLPPERLLVPQLVPVRGKGRRGKMRFQDAFCGAYFTFAVTREGHIYGFGLSNYHQLGELCLCACRSPASPLLPWPGGGNCCVPQDLNTACTGAGNGDGAHPALLWV